MDIDRKFEIMAVSKSSGNVYTEREAIILLARDPATLDAIRAYQDGCRRIGCSQQQLDSIESLYQRVISFQGLYGFKKAEVETEEEFDRLNRKEK